MRPWMSSMLAGLSFGGVMGLFVGIRTGQAEKGALAGLVAGLLFGVSMALFARRVARTAELDPAETERLGFDPKERILFHGPANHKKGIEAVGGTLYLTKRRLRFRSHALNVQVHDESYRLAEIAGAEPVRTLGIIPNGLLVTLADGRSERFVVNDRRAWAGRIVAAIDAAKTRKRS